MASTESLTDQSVKELDGLFQKDPELFAQRSRDLINQTIESFPPEHRARARGIQFKIEAELGKTKDPIARMNRMVELFWQDFSEFQDAVNDPGAVLAQREQNRHQGKVVPFERRIH